jgi:hypothetical protein
MTHTKSLENRRAKNSIRKAKQRELERATLTAEEYEVKKQEHLANHKRKREERIVLEERNKKSRKYLESVKETWTPKTKEQRTRLNYLKTNKLPMDCVWQILEYINPNLKFRLSKMNAQMKQIRLTTHLKQCIDMLSIVNDSTIIRGVLCGSLQFITDFNNKMKLTSLRDLINNHKTTYGNSPNLHRHAKKYNKYDGSIYWQPMYNYNFHNYNASEIFDGAMIVKTEVMDYLCKTVYGLTQFSPDEDFHEYARLLNGIMMLSKN